MTDQLAADPTARPRPVIDDLNRPFWEAAAEGRLELQRCSGCSHLRYPVSLICSRCLAEEWAWETVSGRGTVYSYIVVHQVYHPAFATEVPYNVVLVQLDEGPRMFSNVVEKDGKHAKVGDAVQVVFERIDADFVIPRFEVV